MGLSYSPLMNQTQVADTMNKCKEHDLITLYNFIAAQGKTGATRLSVIRETGLDGSTVAALVKSFPQVFLYLDEGHKITINPFNKNAGMGLTFVQKAYQKHQAKVYSSIIMVVSAAVLIIGLLLN